ncbi:hypothetical protein SASPL_157411 [Salvia splendens]|uniref:Uncharacterized protein n=1 Tax=Salvia splendens TaxID=180675 RepID=A0A8X8VUZ5_SALSN|nr:uncharacterized protein LOC121791684 [Salvia splendens]KAG6382868.1 hypothetical protein SASPL_157411 [Salvia splendens]
MSSSGSYYWAQNCGNHFQAKGIIVVFAWVPFSEPLLNDCIAFYSSLGWNSLVCRSKYLNPFFPERATSLAFAVLDELVKELKGGICPVVLAALAGGSKACMYKVLQIIEGCSEVELNMEDRRLVASCISGQIYDSDPIDFTTDLGARFALHRSVLKVPGAAKLASFLAKGVTLSLDALFLTRFGSQQAEYLQTLYSSVRLGAPFLILCPENEDIPFSTLCTFAKHLLDVGGTVKIIKRSTSSHLGHHQHQSTQCIAITKLLEQAVSIFSEKIQKLGEKSNMEDMHDVISPIRYNLQNSAVLSNTNDHFLLPCSSEYEKSRQLNERSSYSHLSSPRMCTNTVLGQVLFDACVPKNVEGWDIKFSGSLNGEPFASVRRRSPFCAMKQRSRL